MQGSGSNACPSNAAGFGMLIDPDVPDRPSRQGQDAYVGPTLMFALHEHDVILLPRSCSVIVGRR